MEYCWAIKIHLAVYNQILGLGWLLVCVRMIALAVECIDRPVKALEKTWAETGGLICVLQFLVLMDLVHAALGLWPHEPAIGLLQRLWCKVGHRSELFVTLFLVGHNVYSHWSLGAMVLTWALADISRYQMYFCRTLGNKPPRWLLWCRYSDFIVQYPLNILAEGAFVMAAVPHLLALGAGPYGMISYAPIALLFQVYEWCIFIPGYQTLWRVRQQRLCSKEQQSAKKVNIDFISNCASIAYENKMLQHCNSLCLKPELTLL